MRRLLPACALLALACPLHAAAPFVPDDGLPRGAKLRIGSVRLRHGALVRAVAASPDGKWVASASHDRTASVWDVPSGKERFRLCGHNGDVVCLAFSADGATLVTGGADGSLRFWALKGAKAGQQVAHFPTRADSIEAVAFSPDGKRLAAGGDDGTLHVLSAADRAVVYRKQHERGIRAVAWSADGKYIATNGDPQKAVTLRKAENGSVAGSFGEEMIQALAFAPKGGDLVTWEDGGVMRLWDAPRAKQVRKWSDGDDSSGALVYQLAFSADGKSLFAGTAVGAVDEWDPSTGKRRRRLAGLHAGRVPAVAVRGDVLASGGADHGVRLTDLKAGKALAPAEMPAPIASLSVADGGKVLVGLTNGGEVRLWARDGKPLPSPKVGKAAAAAGKPNEAAVLVVNAKGQLLRYDLQKKASAVLDAEGPLAAVALSGDGRVPAGVLRNGMVPIYRGAVQKRQLARGRERGAYPVLSPDGGLVAVVGKAASVAIFETKRGDELPGLAGHGGGTVAAAFSPDGRLLATGGRDRYLRIWEMQTRRQRVKPAPHADWLSAVTFSPDGKLVGTATASGLIQLYSAAGKLEAELPGHRGRVSGLTFVGKDTLVSGGQDGTVVVWDVGRVKLGGLPPRALKQSEREALWKSLGDEDPVQAALAIRELARDPAETVKLIASAVRPVDARQVAQWIDDLDSENFADRESASKRLAALGKSIEGALKRKLEKKPSLEQHRRIEDLLVRMKGDDPGHLRAIRAVELLEQVGNEAARRVLKALAGGLADADLTRDAKAALERLGKK